MIIKIIVVEVIAVVQATVIAAVSNDQTEAT